MALDGGGIEKRFSDSENQLLSARNTAILVTPQDLRLVRPPAHVRDTLMFSTAITCSPKTSSFFNNQATPGEELQPKQDFCDDWRKLSFFHEINALATRHSNLQLILECDCLSEVL